MRAQSRLLKASQAPFETEARRPIAVFAGQRAAS
jgi:hypothetical protein